MAEFYVPKSGTLTLTGGRKLRLTRGIREVPIEFADSREAIAFGLKTVHEMTDSEWISTGYKKPVVEVPALVEAPAAKDPAQSDVDPAAETPDAVTK